MPFHNVDFMTWQWEDSPEGVISLNLSDIGVYPSETLAPDPGVLSPSRHPRTAMGVDALRAQLADLYQVPFEEVLITAGTSLANFLALASAAPEGSAVAIERPTYEPLTRAAEAAGLRPLYFQRPPAAGGRPDLDQVEDLLKAGARAVMITELANPTGAPLDDGDDAALAELCQRHGARLIIDEVYRDFLNLDAPRSRRADGGPRVATGSLTKVYGLGYLRAGWVLGPPAILGRALEISSLLHPSLPIPSQVMAMAALSQRDAIVRWSRGIFEPAVAMVRRFAEVEPRLGGRLPEVGTLWFPTLPEGIDGDEFCRRLLAEHRVRVSPGRFFNAPEGFRVGLGIGADTLRSGLAKISRLLDAMGG